MAHSDRIIISANRADDLEEHRISRICDALKQIIKDAEHTNLFINLIELRDHKGELMARWAIKPREEWMDIVNKAWQDQGECQVDHYAVAFWEDGSSEDFFVKAFGK
jgi:hypothetical protein